MTLWTHETAAEATAGKTEGKWQALRVEIDSRKILPGDLFVALKGENFDGHAFVADALKRGAVAAVVSHAPEGVPSVALLVVEDTQKALDALGRAGRKRSNAKIVGVTGSVGKTSTKEMLRLALSAHGKTYATTGNYNNHIGTPLNLANLPLDTEFAVLEMGMNHAGEIAHLTRMVRPDVAIITTVEAVHIEFFRSIEGIANAKSEIFEGVRAGGVAIINRDNPHYALMSKRADEHKIKRILTFGEHEKADCRLVRYEPTAMGCLVVASVLGKQVSHTMQAVGKHWAMTSLIVLATSHALGLDVDKTARALEAFAELEGRGKWSALAVPGGMVTLIDDSYNASPAAMRAAFAKTHELWIGHGKKGRKIAALGDMLELGEESPQFHADLAEDLQAQEFDAVFTAGAFMQHLHEALPAQLRGAHVAKAADLLPMLLNDLQEGDILLVKGSHGSKMHELVKALTATGAEKKYAV